MNQTSTKLQLVNYDGSPIELDLDFAYTAEARIREISFVNKHTAPELASTFNVAYGQLARHFGRIMYEMGMAEIAVKKRKAVLTLDYIPEEMTKRKLAKGNEDIREAFYYTDPDYLKAKEGLAALEATKELLYIKMNSLRMAFEATKSVMKEQGNMPAASLASSTPNGEGITATPPVNNEVVVGPYVPTVTTVPATYVKQEPAPTVKYRGGWTKPKG
jgi:hypothetical protein